MNNLNNKIRNKPFLKYGSFSLAVTVVLIAAVILINAFVMPTLTTRFHTDLDFSENKLSSLSKDNIKFIKSVKDKVTVTVCCPEDSYSNYLQNSRVNAIYESMGMQDAAPDYTAYFDQTIKLAKKYHEYNKKITVKFADQDEIMELAQKYQSSGLQNYGDIIITSEAGESVKILNFEDIYTDNSEELMYAMYGYSDGAAEYQISENKIETALSGAIYYVTGGEIHKIAVYTRGDQDASSAADALSEVLMVNNYSVEKIEDYPVKTVGDDVEAVVLMPSATDLSQGEVETFTKYLENGGQYGRSMVYFGWGYYDYSKMPNLCGLMTAWGITPQNAILTDVSGGDYTSMDGYFTVFDSENPKNAYYSMIDEAFTVTEDADNGLTKEDAVMTSEYTYPYPRNSLEAQTEPSEADIEKYSAAYPLAVRMKKTVTDESGAESSGTFTAFSSIVIPLLTDHGNNRDLLLAYMGAAVGAKNRDVATIDFGFKNIQNESFSPSGKDSSTVNLIFIWLLPLATLAAGIVIFIRRKNAA